MDKVIEDVVAVQAQAGEASQRPATEQQLATARDELRTRFGASLPDGYAQFLGRVNGVDFHGLVLYGAGQSQAAPGAGGFWQGLVEANALWREGPDHDGYLVLGETDMDLLTVDLDGGRSLLRDKVSGDVNEEFASVRDAIDRLLQARL